MNIKFTIAPVILLGFCTNIFGQQEKCGTKVSNPQRVLENTFTVTDTKPGQSLPRLNRILSVNVFVVKSDDGSTIDPALVKTAVEGMNAYFEPIAVQFKICDTKTVENYQYDELQQGKNEKDLLIQYYQPGTINLYLASDLQDENQTPLSGYSFMPGDGGKHAIFLKKSSLGVNSLAHQMGHFLNLYHTHENEAFGAELVKETNCASSGDRVCDTNADPNVAAYMSEQGTYIGTVKDTNGDLYSPSPKNMMSSGPENIRCFFSRGQYLRMVYALENFLKDLR